MISAEVGIWVHLFLGLLEGTGAGQCQKLPVTGPGQPVWNYKVSYSLWLPLLNIGMSGKNKAAHQGWLPLAPSPGAGQQKGQSPEFCLCLPPPSGCLLGIVTERASGTVGVA